MAIAVCVFVLTIWVNVSVISEGKCGPGGPDYGPLFLLLALTVKLWIFTQSFSFVCVERSLLGQAKRTQAEKYPLNYFFMPHYYK